MVGYIWKDNLTPGRLNPHLSAAKRLMNLKNPICENNGKIYVVNKKNSFKYLLYKLCGRLIARGLGFRCQ